MSAARGARPNLSGWERVAHDYKTLTAFAFDACYPGWASSPTFMARLRQEFEERDLAAADAPEKGA